MSSLTPKERLFVDEYIKDFNGARAARDAGYSERTAREIAYENLTKPHIALAINQRMKELQDEVQVTQRDVLKVLVDLGVKGEAERDSDRIRATELCGKAIGMFTDKLVIEKDGETKKIVAEITSKLIEWIGTLPEEFQDSARQTLLEHLGHNE